MSSTTIHPVRHAHASWTPDDGRALSPEGHVGAERVARLLGGEPIVAIYASTARRAMQTVEPLAQQLGLPVTPSDELRERRLSGTPVDDHGAAIAWCWAHPEAALPGGESNAVAQRRGVAVVNELAKRHAGGTLVVGTHGNLLALILQHWLPAVNHAFWRRLTMPDIYVLTLNASGASTITRRWNADECFVPVE